MTMRERMLAGEPYRAGDPELAALRMHARETNYAANALPPSQRERRMAMWRGLFGTMGEDCAVLPPFLCDYGCNIHAGARLFMNFGCIVLDCAEVRIGDDVQIATAVQIITATHPLDAAERATGWETARPVRIGHRAWIGAGAILLPGVVVGDDAGRGRGRHRDPGRAARRRRRREPGAADPPAPRQSAASRHSTSRPRALIPAGSDVPHRAAASGQRGWKRQPGGMLAGSG